MGKKEKTFQVGDRVAVHGKSYSHHPGLGRHATVTCTAEGDSDGMVEVRFDYMSSNKCLKLYFPKFLKRLRKAGPPKELKVCDRVAVYGTFPGCPYRRPLEGDRGTVVRSSPMEEVKFDKTPEGYKQDTYSVNLAQCRKLTKKGSK